MIPKWIRPLFMIAAAYDILLGVGFAVGFRLIYERFGIELPNHDAYIQLPGLLIAVFGVGFWMVSRDPVRLRAVILLGVMMKLAFSGVVLWHRLFGAIPDMWVPFAIADFLFLVAFLAALRALPGDKAA